MKKLIFILCSLFMIFNITGVNAATITETKYENNKITITGTGDGTIQIVLFGLDNLPLYLTTATAEDDSFSITFPEIVGLTAGDYNIKVSDYDGTNVSTKVVRVTDEKNPQTSDNIVSYIIIGSISLLSIILLIIAINKSSKKLKSKKI